jgi:hypothetical protein
MTMRRLLALLSIATLAVVAAGCGGNGVAVGPDLTSFASAASASAASDTGRFELEVQLSLPGTDKGFGLSASGGFDTPNHRAQMALDLSALAQLMAGFGKSLGATSTGDLPTDPASWRLEAIQDGDTVYVRLPLLDDKLPAGKTWIKGSAKELAAQGGSELGQFGSFADTDPRDTFAYLKAVSGSIETVGGESLRGVDTTHYRAAVDMTKIESMLPADQRQSLGSLDALLGQTGLTSIPIDVWLDAQQRVRKLELSFELGGTGSQQAGASMTMELYDYGKPLDVSLPPADQVVDAATLKQS